MAQVRTRWSAGQPLNPSAMLVRSWRNDPIPPEHVDEIFQRSIQGTAAIAPLANWANAVCISVLAAFVVPPTMTTFRPWWTAIALVTALQPIVWWGPKLRRPDRRARPRDVVLLSIEGLLLALVYAVLLFHVRDHLDEGDAIVVTSTIAGVIGCGAVARSLDRTVGILWVVSNASALIIVLVVRPGPGGTVLIAQLALYAVVLLGAICYLSASFELRCRAELSAAAEREVIELLLDDLEGGSRDWLWRTDRHGCLVLVSARFAECAGRPVRALEGRSLISVLQELGAGDDPEAPVAIAQVVRRIDERRAFRDIVVPVEVAGELRWWALSGRPADDDRLGLGGWHGVGCDITVARHDAIEIDRLVNHDSLTGLSNRHRFHGVLAEATGDPQRSPFAVAIVDLDNFKVVNDTLGHHVGDELLVQVAERLVGALEPGECCARLGGDEFALVVPAPSRSWAGRRLEDIIASLGEPCWVAGTPFDVRASAGFAFFPADADDADVLVSLADQALYAAKGAGRSQVRRFEAAMRDRAVARAAAVRELADAVGRDEFVLHGQPIVDLRSGAVRSIEVLVRWHHPHRGLVPPGDFIAVAEETGLIVAMGERIMAGAFAAAAAHWPPHLRVALNVSPVQLTSPGFRDAFESARARAGLRPDRIDVEVTESAMVDERARAVLEGLRAEGVGVAVDDFGTGFSSFATLQSGPVTQIKIDRAFISQLDGAETPSSVAVVRSIVDASRALGLDTVAEGVETRPQRDALEQIGCDMMQGYLESRPIPLDAVPEFLRGRRRVPGRSATVASPVPDPSLDAAPGWSAATGSEGAGAPVRR